MKSYRLFLTAAIAAVSLTAGSLLAGETKSEKKESTCGCEVGADGKACGVDKDCCCTGEKAKPKEAKKPEEKKPGSSR
ncbi:MAG TPA: hypothetical protein VHF69_12095 [Candidatus Synoicihabitans sp.]|nr:hypothetical protein [Candidatus Synoicihabitans sp.]